MQQKLKLRQLHVKLGMVSINTVPLDFKRNYHNIMQSIRECIDLGCSVRVGSELEVPGYGCADHFAEYDTIYHSWDLVRDILKSGITEEIVCELGCPVMHKAALYNARIIVYKSKVIAIRVKTIAADGDNYNETRSFAMWKGRREVGEFQLPQVIQELTGQTTVPIGVFIVNYKDTSIAYEICEEAWISDNPMIDAALDGAEIFINGSASEIARGKLKRKLQMIQELTEKHGGAYLYVNQKGLLDKQYFQGGNIVSENGKITFLSEIDNVEDVCVMPVIINLNKIRSFRLANKSFQKESHGVSKIPRVYIDKYIANNDDEYNLDGPEHQADIARLRSIYEFPHATYEPSLWLWETLKKSKKNGFHIPLSGGKNSAATALTVYNMCQVIYRHIVDQSSDEVLFELRKVLKDTEFYPVSAKEICSRLLFTTYMETENSSKETKNVAKQIAEELGSKHAEVDFEDIYLSFKNIGKEYLDKEIKFEVNGGTRNQDFALSGVQSRTRMVLSYFISQLALQKQGRSGSLLKLASLHLDYLIRGYYTKYDCSSADLNPIGSFSNKRIKEFLKWNLEQHPEFKFIEVVLAETPTKQLKPVVKGKEKTDEEEMDLTHEEISLFAELRRIDKLGPVSMFDHIYCQRIYQDPETLAAKIKIFFQHYSNNRPKMATMTPVFHYNPESCEDSRIDQRPMIYGTDWSYQFEVIDERVNEVKEMNEKRESSSKHSLERRKSFYGETQQTETETFEINVQDENNDVVEI